MPTIDANASLAALVLDDSWRAELFGQLGFDYCCRGGRSLAQACAQANLDLYTVLRVLEVGSISFAPKDSYDGEHGHDWRRASTAELCDHIVEAHHDRLRRELPHLDETLATVARVHGSSEPSLHDLARVFAGLRAELEEHIGREEKLLFPACRDLEESSETVDRELLLTELEHDHADVGETLRVVRDLAGGYRHDRARCSTHRALIDGLRALERDLHRHIHEENNVLFPRIRGLLAA